MAESKEITITVLDRASRELADIAERESVYQSIRRINEQRRQAARGMAAVMAASREMEEAFAAIERALRTRPLVVTMSDGVTRLVLKPGRIG